MGEKMVFAKKVTRRTGYLFCLFVLDQSPDSVHDGVKYKQQCKESGEKLSKYLLKRVRTGVS